VYILGSISDLTPLSACRLPVGNSWEAMTVDLPIGTQKVTFAGYKGGTDADVAGDIALDDISLVRLGGVTVTQTSASTTTIVGQTTTTTITTSTTTTG
jgi:hypothetical protein